MSRDESIQTKKSENDWNIIAHKIPQSWPTTRAWSSSGKVDDRWLTKAQQEWNSVKFTDARMHFGLSEQKALHSEHPV